MQSEVPYPNERIFHEIHKASKHSKCLHPLASRENCSGKIIDAHTIQRSASLAALVDETKHVRTFYPFEPMTSRADYPIRIGWHEASTFTGFCRKHDDEVFAPLEKFPYTGTIEQDFLLGYRALCHELHQKESVSQTSSILEAMLSRGVPVEVQQRIHRDLENSSAGTSHGLQNYERLKKLMDEQILSGNYEGWTRASIAFTGDLCMASTGVITPNRTITGEALQTLHDPNAEIEPLLISLVATQEGGVISMLWRSDHSAPDLFVRSLLAATENLPGFAVQTLFAYIENTFFSKQWWDSFPPEHQEHIRSIALMPNAYYTDFNYSDSIRMPWEISEVTEPRI